MKLVLYVGDIHSGKQPCTFATTSRSTTCGRRFKTRSSTRRATTSGPTATSPKARAATHRQIDRATPGNYVDYANGDPVANLGLVRQIFFADPGQRWAAAHKQVLSQAQASIRRIPTDARVRRERHVGAARRPLRDASTSPAARTTTPTPGTAQPPRPREQTQESRSARRPTSAGSTPRSRRRTSRPCRRRRDPHPGRHVGSRRQADTGAEPPRGLRPVHQRHRHAHDGVRQARPALQRRLARLPLGQPARERRAVSSPRRPRLHHGAAWRRVRHAPRLNTLDVPNFHRIVVHGSTFPLEYLRVSIDTKHPPAPSTTSFGPFSWERVQP